MKNKTALVAPVLSTLVIAKFVVAGEGKTYSVPVHIVGGMILLDAVVS